MDDETPAEAQPETQSKTPHPPIEPPPHPAIEPPLSKTPDPSIEPPPNDLSHKKPPTPSCKIPVRPNKLRKLSVHKPSSADTQSPGNLSDADSSSKTQSTVTPKNNRKRNPSVPPRVLPIVIKPLSAAGEINAALTHLRSSDPLLVHLIDSLPPPSFDSHQTPFLALTKSILYQQLAFKAGTSIYTRFVELCGGEEAVSPDTVLSLSCPQLRQIGVSARKATYLYDLANKYKNGILSDGKIVGMDDKSLFTMLSMVKGIGSWSVHMFMIFSLHRPDVLPVSDVGVRKGVQILNGLEELPRPSQMDKHCEKWRPYRSVGSWYMWRLVEGKGNQQALEGIMPLQQQQEEETQQQQLQLQLLEPINGSANFGACIW